MTQRTAPDWPAPAAKPPVVIVTGPTASGKSGLAVALAQAFGGVVINGDSMQVYRELAVITARPDGAALAAAPHRLYGVLPGAEPCSAAQWRALALTEIEAAHRKGQLPLVVGGTGLYLRALARNLSPVPAIPTAVRQAARERHAALGGAAFHGELAQRDPDAAARLNPGDSQRLIRAWEVLEGTGRPLAHWQGKADAESPYRFLRIVLQPPRDPLYRTIDRRLEAMLAAGALAEVRALLELSLDPALPVMRAVGLRELAAHLQGESSQAVALAAAQQATRRYAKRQTTWLRTQMPRDVAPGDSVPVILNEQLSESLSKEIFKNIRDLLLTAQF